MYIPFQFNPQFPDATNSQRWEQIRLWREVELRRTDWTQLLDTPLTEFVEANKVKFPEKPKGKK